MSSISLECASSRRKRDERRENKTVLSNKIFYSDCNQCSGGPENWTGMGKSIKKGELIHIMLSELK